MLCNMSSSSSSPELTGLLLAALENPVTCVEDNAEQKVRLPQGGGREGHLLQEGLLEPRGKARP